MRIAVLFYGRMRKYKEHYEQFMNLFGSEHQLDFFLSHSKELNEDDLVEDFINLYKPIAVQNDPMDFDPKFLKFASPFYSPSQQSVKNMFAHFTNKYRVFNLMKEHMIQQNISYDWIVSVRIDLEIHTKILLNESKDNIYIPLQINDNKCIDDAIIPITLNILDISTPKIDPSLYISCLQTSANCAIYNAAVIIIRSDTNDKNTPIAYIRGIKDQLAIGNFNTMKIHSELILNWKQYLQQFTLNHPEHQLLYHLYNYNVPIQRFPLQYDIV